MSKLKQHSGLTTVLATIGLALALLANLSPIRIAFGQFNAPQTFLGTAGGTSSALTLTLHNVNQSSDILWVPLRFVPSGVNPPGGTTLAFTLDNGSISSKPILKQTQTGGLTALTGNEFQSGQVVTVMWDGTEYQCMTCYPVTPAGTEADFAGPNTPSGWLKEDGSAVSRTGQPALYNALVFSGISATTANGSAVVTVPNASLYQLGWFVGGTNLTCNSQILSINTGTNQITLNNNANNSGSTTITIGPYGQGDCSSTFNLPNAIGQTTAMADGSTNITSATCTNAGTIGSKCGAQNFTLVTANLPPYTPAGSISVSSNAITTGGSGTGGTSTAVDNPATITATFTGVPQGGTSTPVNKLMPVRMVYKIIKT